MLNANQIAAFEENGYIVVENLLDQVTLADIQQEYSSVLSGLCKQWAEQGLLDASIASKPFGEQIVDVIEAGLDYFQPLDISLPLDQFDSDIPIHLGGSVFRMMRNQRLLDAVESLIGPEITSNPIQHVRIKPPLAKVRREENRAHIIKTDWHQDRAVAMQEADQSRMVTVWLAITDATVENGCLQVLPGSHNEGMKPHCPQSQLGIPSNELDLTSAQPLPVKAGGAVLFHPLTVHGSLSNQSDAIRWSFDLRYNVTGNPTGRRYFPEFIARSASNPGSELRNSTEWADSWLKARARLASPEPTKIYHRWDGSDPACA